MMGVLAGEVFDEAMRGLYTIASLGWRRVAIEAGLIGLLAGFAAALWRLRALVDPPPGPRPRTREPSCP